MNKNSAKEWLIKAYHDIGSARILYQANHYTDTIGVDLHYSIEKMLKSFLAYQNKKIPKTHNLFELIELVSNFITFLDEEILIINIATDYHIEESYPVPGRQLPPRDEIAEVLVFSEKLFVKVCKILDIDAKEIKHPSSHPES